MESLYPDRDQAYLLIAVTPQVLEVVNEKKGIVGDAELWTPATVRFNAGRRRVTPKVQPKN